VRLDLFLTKSRLIKRRSLAKTACEKGIVFLDGHQAKAGKEVSPGQKITVDFASRLLEVVILRLPRGNVSKTEARELYTVLRETRKEPGFF
jgi:ribosomal 50S subunit-recycling heat shock protein